MNFFISPSPILLPLFGISATYASPLDLAGFIINNTQVTGPQEPAAWHASTIIWIVIFFLYGPSILLAGYFRTRSENEFVSSLGLMLPSAIGCGLLVAMLCKPIETKYRWTQKLGVYLPFRLDYICQHPYSQFTFIYHRLYPAGVFYTQLGTQFSTRLEIQWPPWRSGSVVRRIPLAIHRWSGSCHTPYDHKIEFVDLQP